MMKGKSLPKKAKQSRSWSLFTLLFQVATPWTSWLPKVYMRVSQTPINRVVVDLERYSVDELEEKALVGQGVIYTHNTLGEQIRRKLSGLERHLLLENYYRPWHLNLELNIEQQLARWGYCLLLDCHSFPDEPFDHEDDGGMHRPDICLGVNSSNTPEWLIDSCMNHFLGKGYTVGVDFPYAGCLVPERFFG
jgi:N-formylglutamate amidohydrolase